MNEYARVFRVSEFAIAHHITRLLQDIYIFVKQFKLYFDKNIEGRAGGLRFAFTSKQISIHSAIHDSTVQCQYTWCLRKA